MTLLHRRSFVKTILATAASGSPVCAGFYAAVSIPASADTSSSSSTILESGAQQLSGFHTSCRGSRNELRHRRPLCMGGDSCSPFDRRRALPGRSAARHPGSVHRAGGSPVPRAAGTCLRRIGCGGTRYARSGRLSALPTVAYVLLVFRSQPEVPRRSWHGPGRRLHPVSSVQGECRGCSALDRHPETRNHL